jgi:translation initiation factor IF-1
LRYRLLHVAARITGGQRKIYLRIQPGSTVDLGVAGVP